MHLQPIDFSASWGCVRSNLMCILLYVHIGENYRVGSWHLPFILAVAGKKCARSTSFKLSVALGPLDIS